MSEIVTIKCGMVNCWLIMGEEQSVLVDTAVIRYRDAIYNAVSEDGVKLIFLTHGHADHTGNAACLSQRLGVPVGMHEADAELLHRPNARPLYADTLLGKVLLGGTGRSLYVPPAFKPGAFFRGGETLADYGAPNTEVIALPGHTAGSLGILVGGKDLIAGDAMFHLLRPTPARLYENKTRMLESVYAIKKTGCETIHPGHGKPFSARAFFEAWEKAASG